MFFYIDSNYKIWGRVNHFHFKRGDDLELTLIFIGKKGYTITPEFMDIVFAAKLPGDYSGEFMAYTNTFIPAQTAEGDPCMRGTLGLNSVELASKIGMEESIELVAEFEFKKQGEKLSSQTITLFIHNDLIKGVEGIPSGIMPDYVTKSYVDATVTGNVSAAFEKKVRELALLREDSSRFKEEAEKALAQALVSTADSSTNAGLARNKAEEARKSEEFAFSYKNEASSSALSAVRSAREAADSASGIIRFVERAESSAAIADSGAQTVQNIQLTIEAKAKEVLENSLSAKSSSQAAQESSAKAASNAQSVASGVLIVQSVQGKVDQAEGRIRDSESRVASHVIEVERHATAAKSSESKAATASLAAENSAQSSSQEALRAEGAAVTAGQSAQAAALSEKNAVTKAKEAAQSASTAQTVAENISLDWQAINQSVNLAQQSSTSASAKATEALASAGNAKTSEDNAKSAESNAATSKKAAADSATAAASSAATASQSAQSATLSETSAATKAREAAQSATTAQTVVEDISLDWQAINQSVNLAQQSSTSASIKATEALASAGKAKTSEDNAKSAESNAATSKKAAADSATAAASSATTAAGKASAAGVSAADALASATTAANNAGTSVEKAAAAAGSAVAAAGSAGDSAGSADAALRAQRAAETARDSAESAAQRAESATEDLMTQGEVDTTLSLHDAREAAHSSLFSRKMDIPDGGVIGQILTKTATGSAWGDAPEGGGSFDPVDSYTFSGDNTFTGEVAISTTSADKPAFKITARDNTALTVQEAKNALAFLLDGNLQINSVPTPLKKAGTMGINVPLTLSDSLIINNSVKETVLTSSTAVILGGANGEVTRIDFAASRNTYLDFSVYGEIKGPNNTLVAGLRMVPRSFDMDGKGFSWGWTEDKYSLVNVGMLNHMAMKKPYSAGETGQLLTMGALEPEWADPPNLTKIYRIQGIVDDLVDKDVPDGLYKVTLMMKKNTALYPVLLGEVEIYGANCFGICETGVYYTFTDFQYGAWMNSVGDFSVQPTEFDYLSGTFFWKKTDPGILGLASYGGDSDIILYLEYIREDFLIV